MLLSAACYFLMLKAASRASVLAVVFVGPPICILLGWIPWAGVIKRLHDLNRPAFHAGYVLVPGLNILWFWDLFAKPGDIGANQFGEPPRTLRHANPSLLQ